MPSSNEERLAKLETGLQYIKDKIDSIDRRIDNFITAIDNKYVEKDNINKLEKELEELKIKVDKNREFNLKLTGGIGVAIVVAEILMKFLL